MSVYKGSQKIGDIYYGVGKTNCLTYVPKNVNLTGVLHGTIIGSPTINGGVVSGFSTRNVFQINNPFTPSNGSWELGLKFTTSSNVTTRQKLNGSTAGVDYTLPTVEFARNGTNVFMLCISSNGTSWDIANAVAGTYLVQANTTYWIKFGFTDGEYYLDYSTDGKSFIRDISVTSTAKVYQANDLYMGLGNDLYSTSNQIPFLGSMDFTECYLKINDETVWQGEVNTGEITLKDGSKVYVPNGWDIGQVGIYGSPTIADGVVSGFSTSNYLELDTSLRSTNNAEYVFKFTTGSDITTSGMVFMSNKFFELQLSSGRVIYYNFKEGGYTAFFEANVNTTYWVKILVNGTSRIYSYSTDGVTYKGEQTFTDSVDTGTGATKIRLGLNPVNSLYPFLGSIDLSECYIKINNELVWQGKKGNGERVFEEKAIESDLSLIRNFTETGMLFLGEGGGHITAWQQFSSGSSPSISVQYGVWYDTSNNLIKYTGDSGNTWISGFSFPLCTYTANASSGFTSINQTFDWIGYIGSSMFTLPNVKGLIPNGFNADGTYKNIEFETTTVRTATYTTQDNENIFVGLSDSVFWSSYAVSYQSNINFNKNTVKDNIELVCEVGRVSMTDGIITSLTPRAVQTNNTTRKIARVYKGSTLVYGYAPNSTVFERSSSGSTTFNIKVDGYYQLWLVGAGGGGIYNSSGNKGSSAAGNSGGYVNVKAYLKKGSYTVTVGAGGTAKGGLDWAGWGNNGGNTSITFDGKTLLLAGGGTANKVSYPSGYQQNGTISVANQINSDNFTLTETIENQVGNAGGLGGNGSSPTGGASRYGGYGKGGNVYNRNSADAGGNGYVKVVAI